MRKKTFLLVGSLMLAGLIAMPSGAGIALKAGKPLQPQSIKLTLYLSDSNQALGRALEIHNLLNEMPNLRDTAQSIDALEQQKKMMKEILSHKSSCNAKKMGTVFKTPQKVWDNLMTEYEKKRQGTKKKSEDSQVDQLTVSLRERLEGQNLGWSVSRDMLIDLYAHPEKYGEVNKGGAFPLWQDQISLFEKRWNEFYEALNSAYGVSLKGRPAVDEETRHNAQKYDEVLAAHKAYVKQISQGKKAANSPIVNQKPPKAPAPLPRWEDIVRVDEITGKPVPELPEPWKQMSENSFKNYVEGGEMATFFDGKSMTPTSAAGMKHESDLEAEYNMRLAVDSLEQGALGSQDAQQKMVQPFVEQLKELGIEVPDFDISNRAQYTEVQKQLNELKKQAMDEAYKYVARLEEQDAKNPDYVARRKQLNAKKTARLSPEAQQAVGSSDIIQVSQMSPSVQQRLVLAALEKDEKATVYLTETNAINIDQLMRERRSTAKIIAESHQKLNSALEKQREMLPGKDECSF